MKICAITGDKCFRWKREKTTLFCDTCPVAIAYERNKCGATRERDDND